MPDLATLTAAWRASAATLRSYGDAKVAAALEKCAEDVERADEAPLLAWLSEARAVTVSGKSVRWLREQRREWQARGVARETPRGWEYRVCALPVAQRVEDDTDDRVARALGRVA